MLRFILLLILFSYFKLSIAQVNRPDDAYKSEDIGYFTSLIPSDYGLIASSNLGNDIYLIQNGEIKTIFSAPGCGRYMNLHHDKRHLLFKYINHELMQSPAMIDLADLSFTTLALPNSLCGQPIAANNGDLFLPFDGYIEIIHNNTLRDTIHTDFYANYLSVSPNGKYLCMTNNSDFPLLINIQNGESKILTEQIAFLPSFSPDGNYLAYGTSPENIVIFNIEDATLKTLNGNAFSWHPQKNILLFQKKQINETFLEYCQILEYDVTSNTSNLLTNNSTITMDPAYDTEGNVYFHNQNGLEIFKIYNNKLQSIYKHSGKLNRNFYNPVRSTQANTCVPGSVPYVHQVYDTPTWHAGWGSCAPTTSIMAIAYYNRLPEWPVSVNHGQSWDPHVNNFGSYVADRYRFNEWYYDEIADAYSTTAYGGYGYMWKSGYSPNSTMKNYLQAHYMASNQYWTNSCHYDSTIAEINNAFVHPLCNYLTAAGHLTLCIGYVQGQHTLIFNDPYGDKNTPGYPSYDGDSVYYDWPGFNNGFQNLGGANSYIAWSVAARTSEPIYSDTIIDNDYYGHGFYINNSSLGSHMRYFRDFNSGYNSHSWYTLGMATSSDICFTTWKPNISDTTWMRISVYIPPEGSNTLSAMYQISHANADTIVVVNQVLNKNTWVDLGIYQMIPDISMVYLGDSTGVDGDSIAFDAVKFEFIPIPKAGFTVSQQDICQNDTVIFSSNAQNSDTIWWDFGTGLLQNISGNNYYVIFPDTGVFDITQYVSGTYGDDSLLMPNYITVYQNVSANFSMTSDSVPIDNALVGFTNLSSGTNNYIWDFGDGNGSNQQDPFHIYTNAGYYEVSLLATSLHCPSDSVTDFINVYLIDGINENQDKPVLLYPNPADDIIYLINSGNEKMTWQLFNESGKLIQNGILQIGENHVDISILAKGFYSFHIQGSSNTQFFKLIKD